MTTSKTVYLRIPIYIHDFGSSSTASTIHSHLHIFFTHRNGYLYTVVCFLFIHITYSQYIRYIKCSLVPTLIARMNEPTNTASLQLRRLPQKQSTNNWIDPPHSHTTLLQMAHPTLHMLSQLLIFLVFSSQNPHHHILNQHRPVL